jgi:hypothetical protein
MQDITMQDTTAVAAAPEVTGPESARPGAPPNLWQVIVIALIAIGFCPPVGDGAAGHGLDGIWSALCVLDRGPPSSPTCMV